MKPQKSTNKPTGLVVGYNGETGGALYRILLWKKNHQTFGADRMTNLTVLGREIEKFGQLDVLHICIPYIHNFKDVVRDYQKKFNPRYTVIHSTVPMGTSESLGASHSPIRGVHPVLDKSLWTFKKYVAPCDDWLKEYFEGAKIEVIVGKQAKDSEALKMLSTTAYGWQIIWEKMVWDFCKEHDLDYDLIYKNATETYNQGYSAMDMKHVRRPILHHSEGQIGGHCVMPNLELFDFPANEIIKDYNAGLAMRKVQEPLTEGSKGIDWRTRD